MIQLTEQEKNKIYRLNSDKEMVEAIKKVLLDSFLSEYESDNVQTLAAARLAINFLKTGFLTISRMKPEEARIGYEENPAY